MTYVGEGLIKCHDCGATVPSFASHIDLPGAPEHMAACFRPVVDATMHNQGCTYCHDAETMEFHRRVIERFDLAEQERNKVTVGELLDGINTILNVDISTDDLMKVAEIGRLLFYRAICTADEEDNADFFVEAYGEWGRLVDVVLQESGREYRNSGTGQARGRDIDRTP